MQSRSVMDLSEQFRAIAELRGSVAFIIDCASGVPGYVSPSCVDVLGYDSEELRRQLAQPDPSSPLAPLCAGLAERVRRYGEGDQTRGELVRRHQLRRRDGRALDVEVSSRLLSGAGGALTLVGVLREDLEQGAARERSEERRRFASMLNHEFRTPLSTIDGAIQRLEVTGVNADEPTRARYRKIGNAVDRLIGMLDDYLSPDRMDEIGQTRPPDTVSPALLLDEAAQLVRAAGHAVSVDAADLPPVLRCQPQGLRLVLKMLTENALRHAPGPVALAGRRVEGGIELLVRDLGPGVPPDETGAIFGQRVRASNASGNGSGLGLYMARSVVDVHGGSISMRNLLPKGAEFRIWLPAQGLAGKYVASEVINSDNSAN